MWSSRLIMRSTCGVVKATSAPDARCPQNSPTPGSPHATTAATAPHLAKELASGVDLYRPCERHCLAEGGARNDPYIVGIDVGNSGSLRAIVHQSLGAWHWAVGDNLGAMPRCDAPSQYALAPMPFRRLAPRARWCLLANRLASCPKATGPSTFSPSSGLLHPCVSELANHLSTHV